METLKKDTILKENSDQTSNSTLLHEESTEVNIPSEIPKVIRGPTEYKTGQFRNIREGPGFEGEKLNILKMKKENDKVPAVLADEELESSNAKLYVGNLPEKRKVLLSTKKNDTLSQTNTYNNKSLNMVRAKALYAKEQTTYAEHIDETFCHFFSENDSSTSFINYLERASEDLETKEIMEVFPFLNASDPLQRIKELKNERNRVRTNENHVSSDQISEATQVLNQQIDHLYQQIYDNQLKKAEFSKRLDQILDKSQPSEVEKKLSSDEFWLWALIRKIRDYINEEIEEITPDVEHH